MILYLHFHHHRGAGFWGRDRASGAIVQKGTRACESPVVSRGRNEDSGIERTAQKQVERRRRLKWERSMSARPYGGAGVTYRKHSNTKKTPNRENAYQYGAQGSAKVTDLGRYVANTNDPS